jgi:hypothetical protein
VLLHASVLQQDVPRTLARQPQVLGEADHESERRPILDLNALMRTGDNTSKAVAQTISTCQSIELPFTSAILVVVQPGESGRKQAQSFPLKIGLATPSDVEVSAS